MVVINGLKRSDVAGISVSQYLSDEGYDRNIVAVECDGGIISKQEYDHKKILDGEIIEIVSFAGGG